MSNFPINAQRLWEDILALAEITDPARPYTRRSFSPLFLKGRAWLQQRFEQAGLSVHIDAAGNLIGRLEGRTPGSGTIAVGSHSDTVPGGGRFDGIAGVITALEVVRSLKDRGIVLDHALEVIDFLAEEPSEYGLSCVGSRGITGALEAQMLGFQDASGEALGDAIVRVGGEPARLGSAKRQDIRAFLELHIEQGIVLENGHRDVGIVTAIAGIRRIEIVFEGSADHAGTTPMDLRRDALAAAAETVTSVRTLAERLAATPGVYFVATVGILEIEPGASNVVPRRARIVIDARSTRVDVLETFQEGIERESQAHARRLRVTRQPLRILSNAPSVALDAALRETLAEAARGFGLGSLELASGAGHDAAFMSRICPSAMVFVPCREGKSHTPEEWSEPEQIAAGAAVILEAVRRIDRVLVG